MAHPVFGIKLDNDSIDLRLSRERAIMLNELARSLRARKGKHNKLGKAEDRLLNEIEQAFEYLLTEQSDADYPTILQHARERIERPRKDDALLEGDMLNFDADITFLTTEEGGRGKLNGKDYPTRCFPCCWSRHHYQDKQLNEKPITKVDPSDREKRRKQSFFG